MNQADIAVNLLGIAYGAMLIFTSFVRTGITEAMRIDALFIKDYTEKTRPINLLAGLAFAGYGLYSLLSR